MYGLHNECAVLIISTLNLILGVMPSGPIAVMALSDSSSNINVTADRLTIHIRFCAAYRNPIASIRMICTTIIINAIGICALITDHFGSFVSRTAQGTILKLAAIGVISVPQ